MNKCLIILLAGMLCICGVLVGASRVAQPPSAGNTDGAVTSASDSEANHDGVAAQKKSVIESITKNDMVTAEAACWQLVSQPTPLALHEIVDEARTIAKLPEVRQVFQDMIAARPNDPDVIWLKTGLAIADVHLSDDTAVDVILQDIIARHGSDDRAAEAFTQIAWAYCKLEQRAMALPIYQYAVDNWPQKSRVAYAQQSIATCQIKLGDFAAADKAFDAFVEKFANDADASKLILWTGFCYEDAGKKDKAYDVYGLVVQKYPDTAEAVTAQTRRALASVEAEDPNRMEQNIQTLLTQFAATQDKAAGLHSVADILFWKHVAYAYKPAQRDILALIGVYLGTIANYTLATWPGSDWAMWSERDLAGMAIHGGDDATADAIFQRMLTEYLRNANLPRAVLIIGEEYMDRGLILTEQAAIASGTRHQKENPPEEAKTQLRKALDAWAPLTGQGQPTLTDPESAAEAQYHSVVVYSALHESQSVLDEGAKMLRQWPDSPYAWRVYPLMVKVYQGQVQSGQISLAIGQAAIDQLSEQWLERYPSCSMAPQVRKSLEYSKAMASIRSSMQGSRKGGKQ